MHIRFTQLSPIKNNKKKATKKTEKKKKARKKNNLLNFPDIFTLPWELLFMFHIQWICTFYRMSYTIYWMRHAIYGFTELFMQNMKKLYCGPSLSHQDKFHIKALA